MIYEYRGYQIKPHRELPNSLIVVTSGRGGKIPNALAGMFTSLGIAKREIDSYLEKREDAKTNTESGV